MKNMSKMARLVIILAIITIGSFAIAGIIFYAEYGADNFSVFRNEGLRPSNAIDIDEEKTQTVQGINKIYVSTTSDDINIIKTDSGELKAHYHGYFASSRKDYKPKLTFTTAGDEIKIKVEYPTIAGPISMNSNLKLDVYLPDEYAKNLDIKTSSASVDIVGINRLESFSCQTTSGGLKAGAVNAGVAKLNASSGSMSVNGTYDSFEFSATSGSFKTEGINTKTASFKTSSGSMDMNVTADDLKIESTSGTINAAQVNAKNCVARCSSGGIVLTGNPGKVDASSTSGDIRLEYREYASDITVAASSGSVKIKLPESAEFRLSHKTSSGSSNIAFPVTITGGTSRRGIEGTVVSGRNTINVTTSSGDLDIVK